MTGSRPLEDSSNALYEAALGARPWRDAMDQVRREFNAGECHVLVYDERQSAVVAQRCVNNPELIDHWLTRWAAAGRCPRFRHGLTNPDAIGYDYQFTSRDLRKRSPYYRDLSAQQAAFYLAMRSRDTGGDAAGLSCGLVLLYEEQQGHVEAPQIANLRRLLPHFERATRIALASRGQAAKAVTAVADATGQGAITTDASARVLSVNGNAELLLGTDNAPRISGGRLCAPHHADTRILQRLIASTVGPAGFVRGGDLCLCGADGMPHYALTVAPLPCDSDMFPALGARAVIFITPLRQAAPPPAERLQRLHGLTPQEARVAAHLLTGLSLSEIAETQGLSVRGARFHLNNCYRKLGVPGQAALVRLLSLSLHGR